MSYNVLSQFVGTGVGEGGGVGVLVLLTFRGGFFLGVVQNRESPDFRSPEVGRYALRLLKQPRQFLYLHVPDIRKTLIHERTCL